MEHYETFSTTADVGIRFQGSGFKGLYRSAVKGLMQIYFGDAELSKSSTFSYETHHFEFSGDSCENVLVNLLDEVIYLLQTHEKVTVSLDFKAAGASYVAVDFLTIPLESTGVEPELEIKSVTYHNLQVTETNGLKSAEIIFDI
jgi:SHS2 domain-containing protein